MNQTFTRLCALTFLAWLLSAASVLAGGYTNLSLAVYFRYQEVQSTPGNMAQFANSWANLEKQARIDKVYLETTRNRELATAAAVNTMTKFFQDRGIKVSGGMGLTVQESAGFQSYCYSTQADRDRVKEIAEFTGRYFDEIILDDFYFSNCKCDKCIAAKGDKSWTRFRTEQMDEVSTNLIINAVKAVNPRCRVIIKYPNWYESFQGLGYDLAVEPRLFDAIYTGTETRSAESGQRLQSYQSYLQTQYFNNIKPGGNQGGWIDGGGDARYAEQFWDTFFAKVPEIMLFNSLQVMSGMRGGGMGRGGSGGLDTNRVLANLSKPVAQADGSTFTPNMVIRTAGYSAELLDRFLGKLGKPIGVATYKPCNSVGEAYLPDYLGMIGIPIDLVPEFPTNATTIFLTTASKYDQGLVAKTRKFVQAGGRVIATTGLVEALGDKGFQDIAEIEVTGHRVVATHMGGGRGGAGAAGAVSGGDLNMVLPQMRHFENDTWTSLEFNTAASGYPLVVSAAYGKGTFCVLAIPDDFADLYRLPQNTLDHLRSFMGRDIFVALSGPDHVSLFAYDNRTFILQNFQAQPIATRISVRGARLHDLLSDQTITGSVGGGGGGIGFDGGRGGSGGGGIWFEVAVPAHSFRVFAVE